MRLDRYVSKSLGISRRESKRLILSGRVKVNGRVVKDPSFKVENGKIELDMEEVEKPKEKIYIMLNKPPGFLSSTSDVEPTVLDLIDHPRVEELHIAGRLDKDARGLLILTNDGDFTHKIISPRYGIEKEYIVRFEGNPKNIEKLIEGVKSRGEILKAKCVKLLNENTARIVLTEGKHHEIKRMFSAMGLKVKDIKRVRIGNLNLDVEEGKWRELSEDEVRKVIG